MPGFVSAYTFRESGLRFAAASRFLLPNLPVPFVGCHRQTAGVFVGLQILNRPAHFHGFSLQLGIDLQIDRAPDRLGSSGGFDLRLFSAAQVSAQQNLTSPSSAFTY